MTNNNLPDSWIEVDIGEISQVISGGTPKANNPANFANPGEGIAWITPADLSGYEKIEIANGRRDLTQQGFNSCSAKLLPKGSVLFSSRAPIGYVAIAENDISTNQGFKSFVFPKGVETTYAYYYLKNIIDIAETVASGTTFKELSATAAKKLPFLLPPFHEQKEIAYQLKGKLSQVKRIKCRLSKVPKKLKQFRELILTAAVSGELTEEWRRENDCLISDWNEGVLGDFIYKPSYGSSAKSYNKGKVPVLRMGNIQNGLLDWGKLVFSSDDKEIEKYSLKKGDVLFNRTNSPELVGKTAIYQGEYPAIYAGYLIKLQCRDGLLPEYLNYHLNSSIAKEYYYSVKSDSVSQSNINAKKLISYPFSRPSIQEQKEIILLVDSFFNFAEKIEQQTQTTLGDLNSMTYSIFSQAFNGELTKQWRKNNPNLINNKNSAEKLLKRLKMQKKTEVEINKSQKNSQPKKKGIRKEKVIIPILEVLKQEIRVFSASELFSRSGYPQNATTEQVESFFLDIRQQLKDKKVTCQRKGDEDYFMLASSAK